MHRKFLRFAFCSCFVILGALLLHGYNLYGQPLRPQSMNSSRSDTPQARSQNEQPQSATSRLGLDIQVVRAFHEEVKNRKSATRLYQILQESGAIERLFSEVSDVNRPPDAILFFNGAGNRNVSCLIGADLRTPIERIDSGSVIASVVLEDDPNDFYRLLIITDPIESHSDPEEVFRITPLLTGDITNEIPLLARDVPNLPTYRLKVEYFRMVQVPCTIIARIDNYGRRFTPTQSVSLAFGALFPVQQRAVFTRQDSIVRVSNGRAQLDADLFMGFDLHWGRTRSYVGVPPWDSDFWEYYWWQRFGITFGTTISQINDVIGGSSPSLLNKSFLGMSMNVYKSLNLVGGVSFVMRPDANAIAPVSILNSPVIERDFPGRWERLFTMGLVLTFPLL